MRVEKLDLASPDLGKEKIAALFPNCVTESANDKAIDFDLLKQELSTSILEGYKERYRLEWPGKREAIVTANLPTTKTLRPVNENISVIDWTFNSEWMQEEEMKRYSPPLKKSLDNVYEGFCHQLAGENKPPTLADLVEHQEKLKTLETAIDQLQKKMRSSKTQFKDKVELNQELIKKKKELEALLNRTSERAEKS